MKFGSYARLIMLGAVATGSSAMAGWVKQGEGSSAFRATGPAGFKIVGATKTVGISDDGKTFTITIKMADIDSDNSLRDKHLNEDLESSKYPTISLSVPSESIKEGVTNEKSVGTFTVHGKTVDKVPFTYSSSCTAGVCDIDGSADLNLKDFEVKIRSYLGITVKSEISVSAKFQIKK